MADDSDAPKIHIDSDWKAEAQKEKQKLAEQAKQEAAAAGAGPGGASGGGATSGAGTRGRAPGQMPPANFQTLVSTMATQALLFLGAIPDPSTGQRIQHLQLARHHIDMLNVIDEKTKGNLDDEETNLLASTLYELRQRYIQLSNAVRDR